MGEDFPYNLRVFDETDDPHGSLTFWADQRFDLVYFLNQPRPIFPECLFVTLRFDDAGHKIITLFFLSFTPCDIAVIAIVAHHLFAPVRDMGTHRRQPFQGREAFACLFVFGRIDDRSFLSQILHAFLREGGTDDVTRQILHRRVVFRRNPVATEDIEAGMPPCVEHPHHLFRDLALFQKHPEDLVPENGFQLFDLQRRRDAEHAFVPIKAAVRHQNVAVGIESKKITKRLDGDHRAGDGLFFRHGLLHKHFQGFPGRAAEGGKQFSIIQKIPAKHLGNTEHEMPVGNLFEDIHTEPLAEFHHALLVAGRAEMAALAGERQKIFVAAVITSDAGKTMLQIAAVEVTVDHFFDIRPPETVIPGKPVIINLHEGFK